MSTRGLAVAGYGAVTSVGLTALQTCAAIRAGVSAMGEVFPREPPASPVVGARVPAASRSLATPFEWLVRMASRAIDEALGRRKSNRRVALFLSLPEAFREHPAMESDHSQTMVGILEDRLQFRFEGSSRILRDGDAGSIRAISDAMDLIYSGRADCCLVGGVDSLINPADINRLERDCRLRNENNGNGITVGEGAAFVRLSPVVESDAAVAAITGVGYAIERRSVLGDDSSSARGLEEAVVGALQMAGESESNVSFRVSDSNGERYQAWESLIAESRTYRTRRERFPVWLPATSVGEVGVAAGALGLIALSVGLEKMYAPGDVAVCECASEEGLRAAALVRRVGPKDD